MSSGISIDINENGIATIILDEPVEHNTLRSKMMQAIIRHLREFESNPEIKIIVLKSHGKYFCAGANLKEMQEHELGELMYTLYHCSKPTLALVQGPAFGGGIGLIACCQMVIASTQATFCFSEVKLGLIPAVISPYIINAIGARLARSLFLTARTFDANVAKQMGLCHEVVPASALESTAQNWINGLLENGPRAMAESNRLLLNLTPLQVTQEMVEMTTQALAKVRDSEEGQEGVKAFLEKRLPSWRKK